MNDRSRKTNSKSKPSDIFRHDLRTHLSAVLSLTEMIRSAPDDESRSPLLDALHLAADNAMAMLQGNDQGPFAAQGSAPSGLSKLLEDFAQLARSLTESKGNQFTLTIAKSLAENEPTVAEPVYLHRILMLLLDNAVKYAPSSPVTLKAKLKSPEQAVIEFEDLGPGFGSQNPALLFEAYHRGSPNMAVEGTGLGLWSVRNLVEIVGGTIKAENNSPTGARFSITLPISTHTQRLESNTTDHSSPMVHQAATRILVVDDNATNRLILSEVLSTMGCDVRSAESGAAALAELQTWTPQLALIDIRMEGMDGWTLAAHITKDQEQDMPLVAISSDAPPDQIKPFQTWLQRPIDPVSLHAAIKAQQLGNTS